MYHNPKIMINKKKVLNNKGHYRYYPVFPKTSKGTKFLRLDDYPQIKTEKQLLQLIYNNWGPGDYKLIGACKGRRGLWNFWQGQITDDGYIFYKKEYDRKEVEEWEKLLFEDDEENGIIDEVREEEKKKANQKKYGFKPFLKPSGRRGEFHFWDDVNLKINNETPTWGVEKEMNNEQEKDTWGIKKPKEEEFEKW
ncbi:MAG: hypothetical protein ACOCV1_01525 [Bacillota bacterium]